MEQVSSSKPSFLPERVSVCKLSGKSGLRNSFQYCVGEDCWLASSRVVLRTTITLFIVAGDCCGSWECSEALITC